MQKIYDEVNSLDKKCYDELGLSEDLLMENASISIKEYIQKNFDKTKAILVVAGSGNNGADGIALARMLYKEYDIKLFLPLGTKSDMANLQLTRAKKVGIHIVEDICSCDIVVDAIFGTGLNKPIDERMLYIIERMNNLNAYKIACDIPSGVQSSGIIDTLAFKANTTITMGALKKSLFLDQAKDYVGDVIVATLGIAREIYEAKHTNCYLLEKKDMKLPIRDSLDTHKGTYGHLATIVGMKEGAGILTALSAFNFGVGLSSVIYQDRLHSLPYEIMHSNTIPKNTTAIAIGMGLGDCEGGTLRNFLSHEIPYVIDADLFYRSEIINILNKDLVLTPHPKEFVSLLEITSTIHTNIETLQKNRFKYLEVFSNKYPNTVILLKGANTLIAYKGKIYVNPYGDSSLSFGGSGDVLSGMIASLIAQGYDRLEATISASLAHSFALKDKKINNYAFTPKDLIKAIKRLSI